MGQRVDVGLDAYPDKKLSGAVVQVANVGEQRPNSDAKVFEVRVEIDGTDPTLRPSMTTSNKIIASVKDSTVFIPLECLHVEADTITFVYKKTDLMLLNRRSLLETPTQMMPSFQLDFRKMRGSISRFRPA